MGLSYYGFADDASAIADLLRGRGGPTHPALREACRAAGLRVSGTVAELEARLEESVGLGGGEGEEEEKGGRKRRKRRARRRGLGRRGRRRRQDRSPR